jgi:hypothetical protein
MSTKKKITTLNLDVSMDNAATDATEAFLNAADPLSTQTTPPPSALKPVARAVKRMEKTEKKQPINPDWVCASLWLPKVVVERLTLEAVKAAKKQFRNVPNMSLYYRELVINEYRRLVGDGTVQP